MIQGIPITFGDKINSFSLLIENSILIKICPLLGSFLTGSVPSRILHNITVESRIYIVDNCPSITNVMDNIENTTIQSKILC